ncbi:hypothetical protein HN51_054435 [Arachis hypogaea]|uniref:Transmembrane protein n=1 Tax=Arachis hypogaea TaxID=3818 RepID=A0A444XHQ5_ARAHY|nr:uncharacterized protein LOC107619747 [Arachis ipaensis]XP_025679823.1 uncharacterized protein LOC112779703 [Arachis hypogaea]QHN77005.1 uncharacterized protein DS421_19g648900 [Arachis hypogaea]RYQ89331.1 hypothetical protein Ahy_B09g096032 [Arachis hypogaea]
MGCRWLRKAKELLFNQGFPTPRGVFYLITTTLLSLLLPLSFLLLATLSGAQFYLKSLNYILHQPLPYIFNLALHVNPCVLYFLVSIVTMATLIHGLMGKAALSSDSWSSWSSKTSFHLYIAWILLSAFQFCIGLGIEGSIVAGVYDFESSFGGERSLISRVIFLFGLHETTQVWSRFVVRPVVDTTVYGVARKERWIERVAAATSLGLMWWWRLRDEVETLVVMTQVKREQLLDVGLADFVGWWLYYLTVTIGMVRVIKGVMWVFMISLCRRRPTQISQVESGDDNDDKV